MSSSFLPDERNISGRLEIERNLQIMRQKIYNAKASLRTRPESARASRRQTTKQTSSTPGPKSPPRTPGSPSKSTRRPKSARPIPEDYSPPKTLGLARVLSANKAKANKVSYRHVQHELNLASMYSKIGNMRSQLCFDDGPRHDSTKGKSRSKFKPRVSIDFDTGQIRNSSPRSVYGGSRPSSAPPSRRAGRVIMNEHSRAYKEAIREYITEHSLYEEDQIRSLLDSYNKKSTFENVEALRTAIEELKIELNIPAK